MKQKTEKKPEKVTLTAYIGGKKVVVTAQTMEKAREKLLKMKK